jgi:succinoglycan biosynthesis transport protein ExoP
VPTAATLSDDDSRRLEKELEESPMDLALVEKIQCSLQPRDRIVPPGASHDIGIERFRLLAHRLRRLHEQKPLRTLVVASCMPREGKTLVAINLAAILARNSPRVLLVDADMRRPGASHVLGVPAEPGLADVLEGRQGYMPAMRYVEPLNFYFLPPGHPQANPVELLQRSLTSWLIRRFGEAFDWVVIDSPPLSPFADAHCLASIADGVLLVARAGVTPRASLKQTIEGLNGTRVAGILLNACNDREEGYYYSYYYSKRKLNKKGSSSGDERRNGDNRSEP